MMGNILSSMINSVWDIGNMLAKRMDLPNNRLVDEAMDKMADNMADTGVADEATASVAKQNVASDTVGEVENTAGEAESSASEAENSASEAENSASEAENSASEVDNGVGEADSKVGEVGNAVVALVDNAMGEVANTVGEMANEEVKQVMNMAGDSMDESNGEIDFNTIHPCVFCQSTESRSAFAVGSVCSSAECEERSLKECTAVLPCGHSCGGIARESECLPCLQSPCCDSSQRTSSVRYTASDECAICYTDTLGDAPAIQLSCGHIYHKHCCDAQLATRWSGPRISFQFLNCPGCENQVMDHPSLRSALKPMKELQSLVKRKAMLRLEHEKEMDNEAIANPCSEYYQKPEKYAVKRYAYYACYECERPYFGGEAQCADQLAAADFNPEELICPWCATATGSRGVKECPTHGKEYIGFKCRYCCSFAVFFCFGHTHFCPRCHTDFSRLMAMKKFPSCPVGPACRQLQSDECPLNIRHPPTGEEFAIGCVLCLDHQSDF